VRKIVTNRYRRDVRIPEETYRHLKIALEFAWTTINYLGDACPLPTPRERDAHLRALVRETVKAYYDLERTKESQLHFPLEFVVSDPQPRPARWWEKRHLTR
jgi:hypothetical protein